jgi:predicted dehydrogenase
MIYPEKDGIVRIVVGEQRWPPAASKAIISPMDLFNDNRPVSLGVVGLSFGGVIAEQIVNAGDGFPLRLMAVCDLDLKLREMWSRKLGVDAVNSLDVMLARSDIEAIGLFTPPEGRAELIRRCIDAGRHVITTKPFERSSASARDILDYARYSCRVLHLNSPPPCDTAEDRQIEAWCKEFDLGDAVGARYDLWAGRPEESDGSWYDDAELCPGGVLYRLGIYPVNTLIRLLGSVESVQVLTSRMFTGRPTPDNAQLGLRFVSGALANIYVTLAMSPPQTYKKQMTINYRRGIIYRNTGLLEGSAEDPPENILHLLTRNARKERITRTSVVPANDYQWKNFARAVRGELLCNETDSRLIVHGIEVIEAMSRALRLGKTEQVVPHPGTTIKSRNTASLCTHADKAV